MLVIVPHSTEELKLIRFSKEVISDLSSENLILYRPIPLWIPLETEKYYTKPELKTYSKKIQRVSIKTPEITPEGIKCNVEIKLETACINTHFFLVKPLSSSKELLTEKITTEFHSICKNLFPMEIKIFRLATSRQLSHNSQAIENFVWKKLSE